MNTQLGIRKCYITWYIYENADGMMPSTYVFGDGERKKTRDDFGASVWLGFRSGDFAAAEAALIDGADAAQQQSFLDDGRSKTTKASRSHAVLGHHGKRMRENRDKGESSYCAQKASPSRGLEKKSGEFLDQIHGYDV